MQLQFHRPRKVDQRLHHAIEAVNLGVDYFEMPRGRWVISAQLVLEQFKMHHDGIDRVLHFVTDAGSQPADGCHAPRKLQLRLDLLHRFQIMQGDKSAQTLARVIVIDEIH